jgi:hypothetical protein
VCLLDEIVGNFALEAKLDELHDVESASKQLLL